MPLAAWSKLDMCVCTAHDLEQEGISREAASARETRESKEKEQRPYTYIIRDSGVKLAVEQVDKCSSSSSRSRRIYIKVRVRSAAVCYLYVCVYIIYAESVHST